jgi:hypothetical protein
MLSAMRSSRDPLTTSDVRCGDVQPAFVVVNVWYASVCRYVSMAVHAMLTGLTWVGITAIWAINLVCTHFLFLSICARMTFRVTMKRLAYWPNLWELYT